jgi:hypothetical protein
MNTQATPHARSPWHLGTWSDYLIRLNRFMLPKVPAAPMRITRRQELLAAQDKKRQEQRTRVLELLREVKDKNRQAVMRAREQH